MKKNIRQGRVSMIKENKLDFLSERYIRVSYLLFCRMFEYNIFKKESISNISNIFYI